MRVLTAPGYGFNRVVYSASGGQVVAYSRFSGSLWVWDLAQGTPGRRFLEDEQRRLLFGILCIRHGEAFLRAHGYWPAAEEWPVGALRDEHTRLVGQLEGSYRKRCFTPDGKGLLQETVGPLYRTPDQLAVWDINGQIVRRHALANPAWGPSQASYSPDGRVLILVLGREVELRDATSDALLTFMDCKAVITDHALSPDARWLATASRRMVRLWSVDGRLAFSFRSFRATCETLAFSPDSRLLAAGSREGRVRLWEVASGRELFDLELGKKDIEHVAFAPDGQTLAAACKHKCVVILDVD